MLIIQIEAQEGTNFHPFQSQSHREECWLESYVGVPQELEEEVLGCGGWCQLHIEEGVLKAVTKKEAPKQEVIPDPEADMEALVVDHEYRLTLLELGVI